MSNFSWLDMFAAEFSWQVKHSFFFSNSYIRSFSCQHFQLLLTHVLGCHGQTSRNTLVDIQKWCTLSFNLLSQIQCLRSIPASPKGVPPPYSTKTPTKLVQASNNFMKPLTLKYQSHHMIQLELHTYVVFYKHILKYLAEQDLKFKCILHSNFFFNKHIEQEN